MHILDVYVDRSFFEKTSHITTEHSSQNKYRQPSSWVPSVNRDKFLESYISVVKEEILHSNDRQFHRNLSKPERDASRNLKSYDDIIIKAADKGSGTVVMWIRTIHSRSTPPPTSKYRLQSL